MVVCTRDLWFPSKMTKGLLVEYASNVMIVFLFKFLRYLLFAELVESNDVEIPYVHFLSWNLEANF